MHMHLHAHMYTSHKPYMHNTCMYNTYINTNLSVRILTFIDFLLFYTDKVETEI